MEKVDANSARPKNRWATLAIAAISGAGAIALALPAATASADPAPPPSPTTAAPPPPNGPADAAPGPAAAPAAPPPADPLAAPPAASPPADPLAAPPGAVPNAPAPPAADPNAAPPGRVDNPVGGFSYAIPGGWVESDATHLDYGSALLSKQTGPPPAPGQPPPVANDTRVVLGKLDQKLYASAEPDNTKAATRLASDMGEFFMPYPGTRINQETTPIAANGVTGGASYYEVKFSDATKPNGQIWAGVISPSGPNAPQGSANQRWFVVWLGTSNDPVDKAGATTLAQSVRPIGAPPPAPAPAPAAPPPAPGAPAPPASAAPSPAPGAPAPAPAAPAPGAPPPSPAPAAPPTPGQPAGGNGPAAAPGAVAT
jgi:hypothetical protein